VGGGAEVGAEIGAVWAGYLSWFMCTQRLPCDPYNSRCSFSPKLSSVPLRNWGLRGCGYKSRRVRAKPSWGLRTSDHDRLCYLQLDLDPASASGTHLERAVFEVHLPAEAVLQRAAHFLGHVLRVQMRRRVAAAVAPHLERKNRRRRRLLQRRTSCESYVRFRHGATENGP
jgi:hypothetical protein